MQRPIRHEFCSKCGRTTRWELQTREADPVYVCMGEDQRHPELRVHGCKREVAATIFEFRHSRARMD